MHYRSLFLSFAAALAAGVLLAGSAQGTTVYKWTDDKGVVNYTTEPPNGVRKIAVVNAAPALDNRMSASDEEARYWRERRQREASRDSRDYDDLRLRRETEELRQLQIRYEMQQSSQLAASDADSRRLAREQCLRERRIDCDGASGYTTGYYPPVVVVPRARQSIQQASPFPVSGQSIGSIPPGTIAGTQALLGPRTTTPAPAAARVAARTR